MKSEEKGVLVLGGLGLAALLLLRRSEEGVEAAEGNLLKVLTAPLEGFNAGEGLGILSTGATEARSLLTGAGEGVGAGLSLLGVQTKDIGDMTTAERVTYFMESEGLSEREARKAAYDPSQYESVTGAGFEWTKAGRQAYKAMLKQEAREAKAEAAGYASVADWLRAKEAKDTANRNEAESYLSRLAAALTQVGAGEQTGYVAEGTHVWTEEELNQPGLEWLKNAFALQEAEAGLVPEMEPIPEDVYSSHLASIIDWGKTAGMGANPYG